jgi:hypothetical protein
MLLAGRGRPLLQSQQRAPVRRNALIAPRVRRPSLCLSSCLLPHRRTKTTLASSPAPHHHKAAVLLPVTIYRRSETNKVLGGSALVASFAGVSSYSCYDVLYGSFAHASQAVPELASLVAVLKPASVATCVLGLAIAMRWLSFVHGLVAEVQVVPARQSLIVRAHTLLGRPGAPQTCSYDDFGVGDEPKPDAPSFNVPLKSRPFILYFDSFLNNPRVDGAELFRSIARADRGGFEKEMSKGKAPSA